MISIEGIGSVDAVADWRGRLVSLNELMRKFDSATFLAMGTFLHNVKTKSDELFDDVDALHQYVADFKKECVALSLVVSVASLDRILAMSAPTKAALCEEFAYFRK